MSDTKRPTFPKCKCGGVATPNASGDITRTCIHCGGIVRADEPTMSDTKPTPEEVKKAREILEIWMNDETPIKSFSKYLRVLLVAPSPPPQSGPGSEEEREHDQKYCIMQIREINSLRKLLWLNHANYLPYVHIPYGDDGEMQCCGIDFKRDSTENIEKYLDSRVREIEAAKRKAGK